LGSVGLHKYFFTAEASTDFLLMLKAIPQFVNYYTRPEMTNSSSFSYIIPRRITQDNLENRYGAIKLDIGHNGFNAKNVVHSAHKLEIGSMQRVAARTQKKRNCIGDSITTERADINSSSIVGEIVDTDEAIRSNQSIEIARFNPLINLETRLEREREENTIYLNRVNFIERIQQCRLSKIQLRIYANTD